MKTDGLTWRLTDPKIGINRWWIYDRSCKQLTGNCSPDPGWTVEQTHGDLSGMDLWDFTAKQASGSCSWNNWTVKRKPQTERKRSPSVRRESSRRLQRCSANPSPKQKEVLEWQYPQLDRSLCTLLTCEPECNQMKNKVTLFTVAQQAGPWIINHILIIHGCLRQICAIIAGRTPAGGLHGMKYEICFPQGATRLKEL